jgi:GTP-binding protein
VTHSQTAADCTLKALSPAAIGPVLFTPSFVKSASRPRDFPADEGREVAFAGRSNSGKSSAINAVLGVRKLARTSKTPGRTQLINFFEVAPGCRVVDLPGYGFARVPPDVQRHWQALLETYFGTRDCLQGVLVTVDARRGLGDLDRAMLRWAAPLGVPVGVLLTKADKLSRGAALARRHEVVAELGEIHAVTLFSTLDRRGVDQTRTQLATWLALAP